MPVMSKKTKPWFFFGASPVVCLMGSMSCAHFAAASRPAPHRSETLLTNLIHSYIPKQKDRVDLSLLHTHSIYLFEKIQT